MRQKPSSSVQDECHEAVLDFLQNLSADESELFEATDKSQQLIDDLREIDNAHKSSISRRIAPNLKSFVAGIEQFGSALDVLAGSVSLMSPIWASVRVVLQVAKEFSDYFEKLSSMLEEIGYNLSTIRRYPRLYPDNKILQDSMVNIFEAIVQFCSKALHVFHQGKKHQKGMRAFTPVGLHAAWKVIWKPFNSQFGDIVDDIKTAMGRIEHEVEIAEKELASKERGKAERERQRQVDRWDKLESKQESVTKYIDQQRIAQVNQWLSPVNAAANHNSATKLRHQGTGVWFLDGDAFQSWLSTENSFLWLHAIPGAGKTILASTVINHIREHKQNKNVALAYFYCDYKDNQKQSPSGILGTLLSMLASQNDDVFLRIQTFFEERYRENPAYVPEFDELLNNFSHFVSEYFDEIFLVIDALDESEDRECIASAMKTISDHCRSSKIFITSRNEVDIARTYEGLPEATIEAVDVAEDIQSYVESEVAAKIKARKLKLRDPGLNQVICDKLIQGAHGMFQWVKCQIDQLCKLRNDKAIRNALDDLPKTLHDTYFRILQKLEDEDKEDVDVVQRLLRWLVRGVRSLTLAELAECVSVDPKDTEDSFDFDAVFTDPEDVIERCGSLVTISNGYVGLAHYTVKEFLVSPDLKQAMPLFWVGDSDIHTELASVCLTYLSYDEFSEEQDTSRNGDDLLKAFDEYKFLPYAVQAWGTHAHLSDTNEDVFDLVMRLFESADLQRGNYDAWCRIYQHLQKSDGRVYRSSNSPLYFASLFGLPDVVLALLDAGGDVPTKEPMRAAAFAGHGSVVQAFLDKCSVEPTTLNQCLYAAASRGHTKVVQPLLDHGVNVDSRGGKNGTALQVAALEGRQEVVSVLLNAGADMNVTSQRYGVPLAAAAEKGHMQTFQALLNKGANVNSRGGWYAYPLVSAIVGRNMRIVDTLIDHGADVNVLGGRHVCALMAAASMNMLDLIRKLVDHGARVNDENDKGSDALYAACIAGNLDAVKLLVDLGADINAKGGKHRNALNAASAEGHLGIVKYLLDAGADVDFHDQHYGNALQMAATAGHKEVVRALAEAGVDVNAPAGDRGTALFAAAQNGHSEIVSLLFELGVPSNNTQEMTDSLMISARKGYCEAVKVLVEEGAAVDDMSEMANTYGRCTALEAAAFKSTPAMVKVLLNLEADANGLNDGKYSTPLVAAILNENRSLEVVRMLVDAGADVNAEATPDEDCSSALAAAIFVKDYEIFTYLLENGADINLVHGAYLSCLQHAVALEDDRFMNVLLDRDADVNLAVEPGDTDTTNGTITPLQTAAYLGSPETVRKLFERGAELSIDVEESTFKSALQVASFRGDVDVIQTLIELGSDMNEVGGEHGTALQAAAIQNHDEAVQLLLDSGADIDASHVGSHGSALMAAVVEENESIVKLLIERGADVNKAVGKPFDYPLQAAAYHEHDNIIQMLIDAGANVNSKGGEYATALQAAAREGSASICRVLLDHGADVNIVGGRYGTALAAAYSEGYYNTIWLLFEHGASHELVGGEHGTALGAAIGGSCQTLVERLLRHYNADPNLPVRKYGSPLQEAIHFREDGVFDILLEEKADVNARGGIYGAPLIAAAYRKTVSEVEALLDAGADVNIEGNRYYPTALHAAIMEKEFEIIKVLVDRGANVHKMGGIHGSTLECAAYTGSLPIVRYFFKKSVDINAKSTGKYLTALQAGAVSGKPEVVKYLVKRGADIHARGGKYGSALMACILNTDTDTVEFLLKRGANVNVKGGMYGHVLQAAAAQGSISTVLLLLRYGADVNARGGKYCTALQAASLNGDYDIVQLLIERGADVNVVGGLYRCALHAAALFGCDDICELLMKNGAEWSVVDRGLGHLSLDRFEAADEILQTALERQENGWPDEEDEEDEDDENEWEDDDSEDESEGDDESEETDEKAEEEEEEERNILHWNVESIPFFDAPYIPRITASDTSETSDDDSESGRSGNPSSSTSLSETLKETTLSAKEDWTALEWMQIQEGDMD